MRASKDPEFSSFLLQIGNGTKQSDENDNIQLPEKLLLAYEDDVTSIHKLLKIVFLNIQDYPNNLPKMVNI